jgi:hypothetical protein
MNIWVPKRLEMLWPDVQILASQEELSSKEFVESKAPLGYKQITMNLKIKFHTSYTPALQGGRASASHYGHFLPCEIPRLHQIRGWVSSEAKLDIVPEIELQLPSLQPVTLMPDFSKQMCIPKY